MDLISIPACAMYRSVGTVIVRIRMEVQGGCCGGNGPESRLPIHSQHIPSGCEQCNRTRYISKHLCDCDSVVEECRPYRSSTARSRYVNVCAAICLLLLVGGLTPQSSAAPHPSRTMDRQRRQTSENRLWANPCDYDDPDAPIAADKAPEIAAKLATQAKSTFTSASKYKDTFAFKLHSYPKFDDLLKEWDTYEWLRKFSWYRDEVLPKEKILYSPVSDQYIENMIPNMQEDLPAMYKGLKMIVAGLYAFTEQGLNDHIVSEDTLKDNVNETMHEARAVLCYFSDFMKALNFERLPLPDNEIPDFTTDDKLSTGLLLYRDTLNYLEYISQVFMKLKDIKK